MYKYESGSRERKNQAKNKQNIHGYTVEQETELILQIILPVLLHDCPGIIISLIARHFTDEDPMQGKNIEQTDKQKDYCQGKEKKSVIDIFISCIINLVNCFVDNS